MTAVPVIAIVGDGVAAWMTAATLARRLPRDRYAIHVIEPGRPTPECLGSSLTALPSLVGFHAMLGITEEMILREARGTAALGVAYSGWSADGGASFFPFGAVGAPMASVAFHQLAARLVAAGRAVRPANYSVAALAAQSGRFAAGQPHGLHLELAAYRKAMRSVALAHGATAADGPLVAVTVEDGRIAGLALPSGTISPHLVLDCTGPARLAIGALEARFQSWKAWLPCDRMVSGFSTEPVAPLYGQMFAEDAGWSCLTPLAGGTAELACYSTAFAGSDGGEAFENGRLDAPWIGNCIALGTAAAVAEPLHPIGLQLTQSALARLITLLPATPEAAVEAAEYNRISANELDSVRDFLTMHYATSTRAGPFWDTVRAAPLPERAAYKRTLFEATGRIVMYDEEMFDAEDWVTLFDAHGIRPRRHDALADGFSLDEIERHFARVRQDVIETVRAIPPYASPLPVAAA
ncbi:tryptophan 7-halogenase [Sphingomonas sp. JC676]|uniref:tryptophan 7-halogenase n=1 Tax=Sphingomonas sp. JC676 TaxID=2768065 RepID=UPI001657DA3B|nr:tryptophan 7-halogenase [Sphingomonas sp. JC676]MBC9033402.1 tryptophan 7-halogenase [Sphingomonas sp. JC676]